MERRVEIDPGAGFCFGVEKAIRIAEERLEQGEQVYGLGEMVHNPNEIGRLEKKGLQTIQTKDFPRITSGKVLLRAHGEPPATYELAGRHHIELIDATCPIVISLQKKIKRTYEKMDPSKEQIVIFGKVSHPETIGLVGQTEGSAIVVSDPDQIAQVDRNKGIFLFSQTTMDPEQFSRLEKNLGDLVRPRQDLVFKSNCSICGQMKRRKPDLKAFALTHDVMLFVSGKESSNGAMLFNYCLKHNPSSYWISSPEEIDRSWFESKLSVGISGATSTPLSQLQAVKQVVEDFIES